MLGQGLSRYQCVSPILSLRFSCDPEHSSAGLRGSGGAEEFPRTDPLNAELELGIRLLRPWLVTAGAALSNTWQYPGFRAANKRQAPNRVANLRAIHVGLAGDF